MRFLRQSLTGLFLTAVAVGLLVYAATLIQSAWQTRMADAGFAPPVQERVFAVGVQTAVARTEVPTLRAYGEIRAERSLEIRAATAGRVVELSEAFVEGGSVTAGAVLARIDPSQARAARDRSQADLADAEAEVRDAEAGLELARDELAAAVDQLGLQERALARQEDLATRGVGTSAAVETAELAVAGARQSVLARRQAVTQAEARIALSGTQLQRVRIALAEAERTLADTEIYAPFDGTLSNVTATAGRLVSGNEQLATLIDPTALEVAFRLSTAQYLRLLGEDGVLDARPVTIGLDAAGLSLTAPGRIARDSAAVGEAQSGRLVFAQLDETAGFKPGDFVTVEAEERPIDNVVRLPAGALDGTGTVLVVNAENRLESLPITLLRRQGNDVLLAAEGLVGRDVVTSRSPLLGAGIAVRPVQRDTPDSADRQSAAAAPLMLELTEERRARLIAFVEQTGLPDARKQVILSRLAEPMVPAQMVERLESRMGG